MPQVPLDGIEIEVTHDRPHEEVVVDLEAFARDIAENRFPEWGVKLEREGEVMRLVGKKEGSRFEATVTTAPNRVHLSLAGVAELGFLKFNLAGGAEGVRSRVRSTLEGSLQKALGQ